MDIFPIGSEQSIQGRLPFSYQLIIGKSTKDNRQRGRK